MIKQGLLFTAMGTVVALMFFGCGIKNAVDCHGICTRYQTCFDANYDESGCESRCRDNANKDDNYANDVDNCHSCIDDKSCASATFNCGTPCSNVVP